MEDVACHDDSQAEAYIATIALHALTFPLTEGFQTGTSASSGSQPSSDCYLLCIEIFGMNWK